MPKLTVMVGESGSGKSTWAKQQVQESRGKTIRISRDDLRMALHGNQNDRNGRKLEDLVIKSQMALAQIANVQGHDIIIDDTSLNPKTRDRWINFAHQYEMNYEEHRMETPLEKCIENDERRLIGAGRVGRAVIERQFLESGRLSIDPWRPIVIVDVDGTLANSDGVRGPYDESMVILDNAYQNIIDMVNELYERNRTVLVVSGRHSSCGVDTNIWLRGRKVKFHHLFMRHSWDNRSDVIVKKEILDALLKLVPKEQIELVIDDRPKIIRMWRENGLKVFAARGEDLPEF